MSVRAVATHSDHRECPACGQRLSRFNSGPMCFACAEKRSEDSTAPRRRRRASLPHEEIVAMYRQVGDTTKVANALQLPRSSVWYAVRRAKDAGLIDEAS